jgi:hypothetical protein
LGSKVGQYLEGLDAEYGIVLFHGADPIVFASCRHQYRERTGDNLTELS